MVRSMLSESLQAVISQTLLKKIGGGRVAAHEIMIGTPAIRNLIREDKVAQMYSAIQTGGALGMQTLDACLKTLVTRGASGGYYVFDIPAAENLDLKKAARAVGEKSVAMLPQKELLPLTGYVHGGCSPVGMKKPFPTVFHRTAADLPTIMVSAGRIGRQVQCDPKDLLALLGAKTADIIVE